MIAISYRRDDSTSVAGRLHDRLRAEFGRENVFMDFDSIPYGVDFREHIKQTLERAQVVVAIVGPSWLGTQRHAPRRIDDPDDFVRLEVAGALQRGIPVIPILIDNTPMPKATDLPPDLAPFAYRNALTLHTGIDFHHHADRLVSGIRSLIKHPESREALSKPKQASGADEIAATSPAERHPDEQVPADVPKSAPVRSVDQEKPSANRKLIGISAGIIVATLILLYFVNSYIVRSVGSRGKSAASTPAPTLQSSPLAIPQNPIAMAAVTAPTASPFLTPSPVAAPQPSASPIVVPDTNATPSPDVPRPSLPPIFAATPASTYRAPVPAPPPANDEENVRQLIKDYYAALSRHDLDTVVDMFGDSVDFQGQGRHDKHYIRSDIANYFRRFDRISFDLTYIRVEPKGADEFVATFNFPFSVGQGRSPDKKGVSSSVWILQKDAQGILRIVSQRERVVTGRAASLKRRR